MHVFVENTSRRCAPPRAARAQGFSLIVVLMMLIVIIILGISASQMAINEERGARNERDRQVAFQAAEAALKDAEFEILASPSPCAEPGEIARGRRRGTTSTCFNEINVNGFEINAGFISKACSAPPNEGLCGWGSNPAEPAWLNPNVDFYADAKKIPGDMTMKTVEYGRFSGKTYGTQATFANKPFPKYPPRYIIELIPKNTSSTDSLTGREIPHMFRITAVGFGANPNSQVVLQSVVSTKD